MASTFAEMNGASIAAEDCNTAAHMDPTGSESHRVVPGFAKEKTIVPRTKPDATNPAALSARNSPEKRYMTPLQLPWTTNAAISARQHLEINSTEAGPLPLAATPKTRQYKHKEGRCLCTRIPR